MKVLFIDNFDSFTYNLVDEFQKRGCEVLVYRNDTPVNVIDEAVKSFKPKIIVISPGASTPKKAGNSIAIIKRYHKTYPILGICLGHQCIIEAFGGKVSKAPEIMHGKPSKIEHNNNGIFLGIENPLQAGRYHSLHGSKIPPCLEITATYNNIVMAVKHKKYDVYGLQFHPESILTPAGGKIIENLMEGYKMIKQAIQKLLDKKNLTQSEAETVMNEMMSGQCTDAQIAAFLIALRQKGETVDEITACAKIMRQKASRIKPKDFNLIDVVGTGGDKTGTFNISTTTAFVVAGCGLAVAKHGNKSISSKSGSADVLAELGINIMLEPKQVEDCINKAGIGFMFAPKFHPAMKYAIGPRKELGVRTVFNILGPLTNPAEAPYELMGVFDSKLVEPLAKVLGKLGLKHALVVHGNGMDELTLTGNTKVAEMKNGKVKTYDINPKKLGFKKCTLKDLQGGDAKLNAKITLDILKGKLKGPKLDVVLLNSAAALVTANKVSDLKQGIELAKKSISSGAALKKLEQLKKISNEL